MTDSATLAPAASSPRSASRIGSFLIGGRVPGSEARLGHVALVSVTGAPETPFGGAHGFGYCLALPEQQPVTAERAKQLLARLHALVHPALVPVVEAGVQVRVAYSVESPVAGERLSARLERDRKLQPWQTAIVVHDLAAGLATAHAQRISHGAIVPQVIWIDQQHRVKLGGFGLLGKGANRDQQLLAALAFELLTGQMWRPEVAQGATGEVLVDRVRGQASGLTQRIAAVIGRGLEGEATAQFPDIQAFAKAYQESIVASSVDLAAGAWEAVSREDVTMATLLVDMTSQYNPTHPELSVLRLRLNGGAMQHPTYAAAALAGPASVIPMTAAHQAAANAGIELPGVQPMPTGLGLAGENVFGIDPSNLPPGMNPAVQQLLATPPMAPEKPKYNPWVIFAAGAFACVVILTILVALTFNSV